jgi:HSP20 family protein
MPSVNVKETETHYEIEMAVPGLKKEDFKINIDRNILTISSESQTENEERDEKKNYTRREFNYQSFTRSFTMPSDIVDVEHIEAKYDNGILKLAVPKRENAKKEVKTIEIK